MFDWLFRASCPVEPDAKSWLEERLAWLTEEFGVRRLRGVKVILPTPEYFPDRYDGSREAVRALLNRVCKYMGLKTDRVRLRFFEDHRPDDGLLGEYRHEGAAGTYAKGTRKDTVSINTSLLDDPEALVATMAHELGHVHLLSDERIDPETPDHEPLTDLLTVFLGLGIFTANATIRDRAWTHGQLTGWSIGRQGYMSQRMYGYALALFAQARGETQSAWAKHLRLDVRSAFKKGRRYLAETGDTTFKVS